MRCQSQRLAMQLVRLASLAALTALCATSVWQAARQVPCRDRPHCPCTPYKQPSLQLHTTLFQHNSIQSRVIITDQTCRPLSLHGALLHVPCAYLPSQAPAFTHARASSRGGRRALGVQLEPAVTPATATQTMPLWPPPLCTLQATNSRAAATLSRAALCPGGSGASSRASRHC